MHASMYVLYIYIYVQIHVDASKSIREMEIPKYLIMWNRESKNLYIILCIYIYTHTRRIARLSRWRRRWRWWRRSRGARTLPRPSTPGSPSCAARSAALGRSTWGGHGVTRPGWFTPTPPWARRLCRSVGTAGKSRNPSSKWQLISLWSISYPINSF